MVSLTVITIATVGALNRDRKGAYKRPKGQRSLKPAPRSTPVFGEGAGANSEATEASRDARRRVASAPAGEPTEPTRERRRGRESEGDGRGRKDLTGSRGLTASERRRVNRRAARSPERPRAATERMRGSGAEGSSERRPTADPEAETPRRRRPATGRPRAVFLRRPTVCKDGGRGWGVGCFFPGNGHHRDNSTPLASAIT